VNPSLSPCKNPAYLAARWKAGELGNGRRQAAEEPRLEELVERRALGSSPPGSGSPNLSGSATTECGP
jgi:hypothetical protein